MTTSKLRDAESRRRDIGNRARHTKAAPRSSSFSPRLLGAALTSYSVQKPRERKPPAGGPPSRNEYLASGCSGGRSTRKPSYLRCYQTERTWANGANG
jgi:hypothetical protein